MTVSSSRTSSTTNEDGEKQPLLLVSTDNGKKKLEGQQQQHTSHKGSRAVLDDALDTVFLAVPIFASMVSWVGMKTTDSALLGHVSAEALAAASLSDLVRSICRAVPYDVTISHYTGIIILRQSNTYLSPRSNILPTYRHLRYPNSTSGPCARCHS
jgi:hypothetical protein